MATDPYPKLPTKAWTTLRSRAAAAPTARFTPNAVAALMGMANPQSAQTNTVRPMRQLGLIDEDGALTDRGNRWRLDASYGEACQEILDEIYPGELGTLIDEDGDLDAGKVRKWFDHEGFGESNARQMTSTYVMIASKRIPEAPATDSSRATKEAPPAKKTTGKPLKPKETVTSQEVVAHEPPVPPAKSDTGPTVHLDVQIHIPADATPEQIDQIFSSMARHLYAK